MDARLREGIALFNAGQFFESHESLEEIYSTTAEEHKPFLEGLIMLAAACRLYRDFDEVQGPVRMVRQALIRLENYQPIFMKVKVTHLIEAMEAWAKLAEADGKRAEAQIPKIRYNRFLIFC